MKSIFCFVTLVLFNFCSYLNTNNSETIKLFQSSLADAGAEITLLDKASRDTFAKLVTSVYDFDFSRQQRFLK